MNKNRSRSYHEFREPFFSFWIEAVLSKLRYIFYNFFYVRSSEKSIVRNSQLMLWITACQAISFTTSFLYFLLISFNLASIYDFASFSYLLWKITQRKYFLIILSILVSNLLLFFNLIARHEYILPTHLF